MIDIQERHQPALDVDSYESVWFGEAEMGPEAHLGHANVIA